MRRVTYEQLATWTQHAVQVVSFDWIGQQALNVVYRDPNGAIAESTLFATTSIDYRSKPPGGFGRSMSMAGFSHSASH